MFQELPLENVSNLFESDDALKKSCNLLEYKSLLVIDQRQHLSNSELETQLYLSVWSKIAL